MALTPKQYASKYLQMEVFVFSQPPAVAAALAVAASPGCAPAVDEGSWVPVRVGSYRLGAAKEGNGEHYYFNDLTAAVKGHGKIKTRIKRIDGVVEAKEYDYHDIVYGLVAPFYGKGYPEEVQLALQTRYRFQKTKFGLKDFAAASFIGLDCNGFVGGYMERRGAQSQWLRKSASKTSTRITELLGPPMKFFTSWNDFKPPGTNCLILGLCDQFGNVKDHDAAGGVGHIVITEPGTLKKLSPAGPVEVEAVESTGHIGLTSGTYVIKTMYLDRNKRAFFLVNRGHGKGEAHFRITELWP